MSIGEPELTIEQAVADLKERILGVSPQAVLRLQRRSDEEAIIRVYAPAEAETPIQEAVRDRTLELLTKQGLDIQVLIYDIATSLPPGDAGS